MIHVCIEYHSHHQISKDLVLRAFIEDVLELDYAPCLSYQLIPGPILNTVYASFCLTPKNAQVDANHYYEAIYSTMGPINLIRSRSCHIDKAGFCVTSIVSTSNISDVSDSYEKYVEDGPLPDMITYQTIVGSDIPVQIPGFTVVDRDTTFNLFKDDKPLKLYVATFKRNGVTYPVIHKVMDTTFDAICPDNAARLEQVGIYRTWLLCV